MHESNTKNLNNKSAEEFLGNPSYPAISYGGYREPSRDFQPSISEIKEDFEKQYHLQPECSGLYFFTMPD